VSNSTRLKWLPAMLGILPGSALAYPAVRQWIPTHKTQAVLLVIGYEIILTGVTFIGRVYANLQVTWAQRLSDSIDTRLVRRYWGYRKRYLQYLRDLHLDDDLTGIPIRAPFSLPLADIFVDLSLVTRPLHSLSSDIVTASATTTSARVAESQRRETIWKHLYEDDRVLLAVVGAPGSGKTTLLRHVALTLASGRQSPSGRARRTSLLPILLYLREQAKTVVASPEVKLSEMAAGSLRHVSRAPTPSWFEAQLTSGNCLVMLDGLDEVADRENRLKLVQRVQTQVASYPQCSFIITSRPHGYQETPLNAATVLQVRALSQSQIDDFVRRWSLAAEIKHTGRNNASVKHQAMKKADDLLIRMDSTEAIQDLAANPLLLTMIVHLHNYHFSLPGSRLQLYREICQVLLGKRQEAKGLSVGELTADQKEVVLRHMASVMMNERRRDIVQSAAELAIVEPLARVKPTLLPADYLKDIEKSSGIVVERENGVLAFVHQTLQEYLAACAIREHGDLEILRTNVNDVWWRETILLYCGQANATTIVRSCLESKTPVALALAADCAEIARELDVSARQAVDSALSLRQGSGDSRDRRVVAAALLERKLRKSVRIDHNSRLVNSAVTWSEWLIYDDERHAVSRALSDAGPRPRWRAQALTAHSKIACGIDAREAFYFASWITNLVSDGWSYRLPTEAETHCEVFRRVLDFRQFGFWTAEEVSKGKPKLALNPEARYIPIDAKELFSNILQGIDLSAIERIVRSLNSETRHYLRARLTGVTIPGAAYATTPQKGTAELLQILTIMQVLADRGVTHMASLIAGLFAVDEYTALLELHRNLSLGSVSKIPIGDHADLAHRAEHVLMDVVTLADCVTYQLRYDWMRHFAWQGESLWHRFLLELAPNLTAHVDYEEIVRLAEHGHLLIDREEHWSDIEGYSTSARKDLIAAADALLSGLATSPQTDSKLADAARLDVRVSNMICYMLADKLRRGAKVAQHGGSAKFARFAEIYSRVAAGLYVYDWQLRGYVQPIEAILLVRE
jgi:hypothetical protein